MEYIIDSGKGGDIINSYLQRSNNRPLITIKTNKNIGNLKKNKIKRIFFNLEKKYNLGPKNTYLGCVTLNSIFREYKGSYHILRGYLDSVEQNHGNYGLYCTKVTSHALKDLNMDIISLKRVAKDIDKGLRPVIFSEHPKIILGCTHYDLASFKGHNEAISISERSAMDIVEIRGN